MLPFTPFKGPEHQDFLLEGENPAALLIHGYPGTPFEMRPLADGLQAQGWTCRGLLLPGFGKQLESLPGRVWTEWLDAVSDALEDLGREHTPLLVVGHSLGAALAICAAASLPVDGLILLAPFWRSRTPLWTFLPLLKHLVPRVKPFKLMKTEMDDPKLRAMIQGFLPEVDLEAPQVQQAIREFILPVGMFDELRKLGMAAWRAAPGVRCQTWVLQGMQDDTVQPADTLRLARRFGGPAAWMEFPAGHELPFESSPVFPQVREAVLDIASQVLPGRQAGHLPGPGLSIPQSGSLHSRK